MVTHWVLNASPVILLGKVGQLDLLRHLGTEVVIPMAAVREVNGHGRADSSVMSLAAATWLKHVDPGVIPATIVAFGLGEGETAVLAYAAANPDYGAVFDDRAARIAASSLAIPHLGTLGVVVSAKTQGHIAAARPVVEMLRNHGMYLSDRIMNRALAQVGE